MSRAFAVLIALMAMGCLAPRQPAEPRFFSPGGSATTTPSIAVTAPNAPELRLRRVFAADYLRKRMVWRRGVEVGFHDLLRWTEPPSRYVEARLVQELFERRGLRRATRPSAHSLSVELLAFDDVLEPDHEGVVSLQVLLVGPSQVAIFDRTFTTRRPIASDEPEEVARALGEALSEAVGAVGAAVQSALGDGLP